MDQGLTIRQVSEVTGVTAHTLRYYERIGLVRGVPRARSGHRRYREEDVTWLVFLRRMQQTGMPIRRLQEYAALRRKGDLTSPRRRHILEEHRQDVLKRIGELTSNLAIIEKKIAMYEQAEAAAGKVIAPPERRSAASARAR